MKLSAFGGNLGGTVDKIILLTPRKTSVFFGDFFILKENNLLLFLFYL